MRRNCNVGMYLIDKAIIIRRVVRVIRDNANPERIWLYGSQANGENRPGSDIDIAFADDNTVDIENSRCLKTGMVMSTLIWQLSVLSLRMKCHGRLLCDTCNTLVWIVVAQGSVLWRRMRKR